MTEIPTGYFGQKFEVWCEDRGKTILAGWINDPKDLEVIARMKPWFQNLRTIRLLCDCELSDAWRCAQLQNLTRQVSCHCTCHSHVRLGISWDEARKRAAKAKGFVVL